MTAPLLVVEVVSASDRDRGYRHKRSEYAVRGIPEYWIIDPAEEKVVILTLVEGFYDAAEFTGTQSLQSSTFQKLTLTANQVLNTAIE